MRGEEFLLFLLGSDDFLGGVFGGERRDSGCKDEVPLAIASVLGWPLAVVVVVDSCNRGTRVEGEPGGDVWLAGELEMVELDFGGLERVSKGEGFGDEVGDTEGEDAEEEEEDLGEYEEESESGDEDSTEED